MPYGPGGNKMADLNKGLAYWRVSQRAPDQKGWLKLMIHTVCFHKKEKGLLLLVVLLTP
jgi:hypothetical protein